MATDLSRVGTSAKALFGMAPEELRAVVEGLGLSNESAGACQNCSKKSALSPRPHRKFHHPTPVYCWAADTLQIRSYTADEIATSVGSASTVRFNCPHAA